MFIIFLILNATGRFTRGGPNNLTWTGLGVAAREYPGLLATISAQRGQISTEEGVIRTQERVIRGDEGLIGVDEARIARLQEQLTQCEANLRVCRQENAVITQENDGLTRGLENAGDLAFRMFKKLLEAKDTQAQDRIRIELETGQLYVKRAPLNIILLPRGSDLGGYTPINLGGFVTGDRFEAFKSQLFTLNDRTLDAFLRDFSL